VERKLKSAGSARRSVGIRCLLFLCLALVSVSATAQVLHVHADDLAGTAKHCSICSTLHSSAPLTHALYLDFSFRTAGYLSIAADSDCQILFASFALFSRPPPLV